MVSYSDQSSFVVCPSVVHKLFCKQYLLLNAVPNLKQIHKNVPHLLSMKIAYCSGPLNTRPARALDIKSFPPELLVQIHKNITEMSLMMPSTKISQWFCSIRALDKKYTEGL